MKTFTVNTDLNNLTKTTTASYAKIMVYCKNRPSTRRWLNTAKVGEKHITTEPLGEEPRTITRIS